MKQIKQILDLLFLKNPDISEQKQRQRLFMKTLNCKISQSTKVCAQRALLHPIFTFWGEGGAILLDLRRVSYHRASFFFL